MTGYKVELQGEKILRQTPEFEAEITTGLTC